MGALIFSTGNNLFYSLDICPFKYSFYFDTWQIGRNLIYRLITQDDCLCDAWSLFAIILHNLLDTFKIWSDNVRWPTVIYFQLWFLFFFMNQRNLTKILCLLSLIRFIRPILWSLDFFLSSVALSVFDHTICATLDVNLVMFAKNVFSGFCTEAKTDM